MDKQDRQADWEYRRKRDDAQRREIQTRIYEMVQLRNQAMEPFNKAIADLYSLLPSNPLLIKQEQFMGFMEELRRMEEIKRCEDSIKSRGASDADNRPE